MYSNAYMQLLCNVDTLKQVLGVQYFDLKKNQNIKFRDFQRHYLLGVFFLLIRSTCLRSWLEHETSCPTCRYALNIRNNEPASPTPAPQEPRMAAGLMGGDTVEGPAPPVRPRRGRGHFFHFDGEIT